MNLQELFQARSAIYLAIDDNDGVLEGDLEEQLDNIEAALEEKAAACIGRESSLKATAAAEKERADRIIRHSKALLNEAARLSNWVLTNMKANELQEISAGDYRIKLAKTPAKVIVNEADFWAGDHADYIVPQDPKINKAHIKRELKAGKEIPGCSLSEQGERLKIS